jgi:hypothetical protein
MVTLLHDGYLIVASGHHIGMDQMDQISRCEAARLGVLKAVDRVL